MKPTILCVDEDGVLTSAQGHTRLLFGCDDHDMLGLPYHLFCSIVPRIITSSQHGVGSAVESRCPCT